mgnify:CR=1 FL=1
MVSQGQVFNSDAAPLVDSFLRYMHLKKIGGSVDIGSMDVFRADCYLIISSELDKINKEELDRAKKKK